MTFCLRAIGQGRIRRRECLDVNLILDGGEAANRWTRVNTRSARRFQRPIWSGAARRSCRRSGRSTACARGPISHTRRRPSDGLPVIAGGDAVLCAARVEPHVEPGQIWVTEEFRAQLAERPSLWRTTPVAGPDGAHQINVKKEGGMEPDLWVQLHRLEF